MRRILILLIILVLLPSFVFAGKYYNGSDWLETVRKRWDGSAWVDTTTKRWDGTSWNVISSPIGETLFYLDFEDIQSVDLAGWTIDQPGGVLTADYTPAISGLESLYMKNNGGSYNSIYSPLFTPKDELHYFLSFRSTDLAGLAMHGPGFYSEGVLVGRLQTDGSLYKASHGGVVGNSVLTREINTTYNVCGKIIIATAGTGVHNVNVGTSADPSLNNTVTLTTGAATGLIDQVRLGQYGNSGIIIDDFILRTSPIEICSGAGL